MHSWIAISLLVASAWAAAAPVSSELTLRNARAVWKDGRAHIVIDCADKAEYAERERCGFGAICCAVLPEALEFAVQVKQGGPFVTSVARNAIRIDGAFQAGEYDVVVHKPLRTRRGTVLARPFTAHVDVPPPPPPPSDVGKGPPPWVPDDGAPPPGGEDLEQRGSAGSRGVLKPAQPDAPIENRPWRLDFELSNRAPTRDVDVRLACFAKLVGDARDRAACTSFHFDSLFDWVPTAAGSARLDAHGRATLTCPPVADTPLIAGGKMLAAVVEARDAQSGEVLGRTVAQTVVRPKGPDMRLEVISACDRGPLQLNVVVEAHARGQPCDHIQLTTEAVWTEWAWDYGGGRERSVVQPWRTQLTTSATSLAADEPHRAHVRVQATTTAPHVLVRAQCGDGEATRVVANPCFGQP